MPPSTAHGGAYADAPSEITSSWYGSVSISGAILGDVDALATTNNGGTATTGIATVDHEISPSFSGAVGHEWRGIRGIGRDDRVRVFASYAHTPIQQQQLLLSDGSATSTMTGTTIIDTAHLGFEYAPDIGLGRVRPYIGASAGASRVATYITSDSEPTYALSALGKVGLQLDLSERLAVFGEYAYQYVQEVDLDAPDAQKESGLGRVQGFDASHSLVSVGLRYTLE